MVESIYLIRDEDSQDKQIVTTLKWQASDATVSYLQSSRIVRYGTDPSKFHSGVCMIIFLQWSDHGLRPWVKNPRSLVNCVCPYVPLRMVTTFRNHHVPIRPISSHPRLLPLEKIYSSKQSCELPL